ncbi:MAG TPA: hypothetical protein DCZ40_13000 [Lachnospiraceae bacterium]|nr:hypothetical protein [Lachnospiraceae bacterium]
MAVKIEVKGPIVSNDTAWLYHYFGLDACSPKDISKKLAEAAGDDVILEINSPGGVCSYGYEMYTALMGYEGKVTAHVIMAASAASLLVCAADEALASDTCIFMIHNTQSTAEGDYRDMQASADLLLEFNAGIINAYVRKTGKSREELQEMMDSETYMSPQKAIENGFIDGYMFGDPDDAGQAGEGDIAQGSMMLSAVNAAFPVIAEEKAKEIIAVLKLAQVHGTGDGNGDVSGKAGIQPENMQEGSSAASKIDDAQNNQKEGEKKEMTLEELYAEHPEIRDEVAALVSNAETEGAGKERARLEALDKIAHSVTGEALEAAKYGETRMDAKELAYQALMEDGQKSKNYMANAMEDSAASGVEEVGAGVPGEETEDESDGMAMYVNAVRKGGKK